MSERIFVFNVRVVADYEVSVRATSRKEARAIHENALANDPRIDSSDAHLQRRTVRFLREEPIHD